jgi:hypothetical protein
MNVPAVMPITLSNRSKELNDKFYLILNEIIKAYPSVKANGANSAAYELNMQNMEKLQNDYFLYKNQVITMSETVQKSITASDVQINSMENQSKVLKIQLTNLKDSSKSAEGLFDDAQITRNQLLTSNFVLFGIMVGGGYMYYKSIKA